MLYQDIVNLERRWHGFNNKPFSSTDLIELSRDLSIIVAQNHLIEKAGIFKFDGKTTIIYNPHQPELDLILALGHELGHYALGHVTDEHGTFHPASIDHFSFSGIEKDAGIIGFLFWAPSHILDSYSDARFIPERLFDSIKHFSDEVSAEHMVEVCNARGRIYNAFKRKQKNLKYRNT